MFHIWPFGFAIGAQADILLEPVRRDSGPAIVAGAQYRFLVAGQLAARATSSSWRCSASTMWWSSRRMMRCWWQAAKAATDCAGS